MLQIQRLWVYDITMINQQDTINKIVLEEALSNFFGRAPRPPSDEPINSSWLFHEDLGKILVVATQCHDIPWITWALKHDLPAASVQSVFHAMINRDNSDISPLVKIFLPYIDAHLNNCYPFTQACFHQHDKTAQLLLEHIDHGQHTININLGLNNYISMGGTGALIDQILALHDPQIPITYDIIHRTAQFGHVGRLATFIERATAQGLLMKECQCAAAMGAIAGGHFDVFEQAVSHIPDYSQRIGMNVGADEKNTYLGFHARIEHKRLTDHVNVDNIQPAKTPRM